MKIFSKKSQIFLNSEKFCTQSFEKGEIWKFLNVLGWHNCYQAHLFSRKANWQVWHKFYFLV